MKCYAKLMMIYENNEYFDIEIKVSENKVYEMELSIVDNNGRKEFPCGESFAIKKNSENDRIVIRFWGTTDIDFYRICIKLYADGKLEAQQMEKIQNKLCGLEIKYEVIENSLGLIEKKEEEDICGESEIVIRNMVFSWRVESNEKISIFSNNGKLIFLENLMAKVWRLCDGKNTPLDISQKLGIDIKLIAQAINILTSKGILKKYI